MTGLFDAAGKTFLKAFIAALIVYAGGILWAPELTAHKAYVFGIAALLAAVAGVVAVIQAYLPYLSFEKLLGVVYGPFADAFARGFLGSLVITLSGIAGAPDYNTLKSLLVAAVVGAFNAGVRALEGILTKGTTPVPKLGIPAPRGATN